MNKLILALTLLCLPAAARAQIEMVEVAPGIRLHVERVGNGPELVIVPAGFLYPPEVRQLARPERTLILYDMRNRGRSSRVEDDRAISIHADVADLGAIHRRYSAGRASLVGYSYLGLMVMLYAAEHPDRVARVAQIGPVPIRWDTPFPRALVWDDPTPVVPSTLEAELRSWRDQGRDRAAPADFCLLYYRAARLSLVGDPALAERIDPVALCAMENEWPVNFERHLTLHFGGSVRDLQPPRDAFRALRLPLLVIHGTMDRNATFAAGVEWAMTVPDARLLIARGAAHNVWLDRPHIFNDIDRFLAGEWPEEARPVGSWDEVRARLPQGLGPPTR
jgi:pimeloyl-ACP methyl ester carboxylesterase